MISKLKDYPVVSFNVEGNKAKSYIDNSIILDDMKDSSSLEVD